MILINRILLLCLLNAPFYNGQLYSIEGKIQSIDNPLAFANVFIKSLEKGTVTDEKGAYKLEGLRAGIYSLEVSFTGYISVQKEIRITDQNRNIDFQFGGRCGSSSHYWNPHLKTQNQHPCYCQYFKQHCFR